MKTTVYLNDFRDAFRRFERNNHFSYEGMAALFNYLEEYEDSTGEEVELDVIGLCCDFAEYADLEEFHGDFDKERFPDVETIQDHTTFIPVGENGFIIGNL